MDFFNLHTILLYTQRTVSFIGIFIIVTGVVIAFIQYLTCFFSGRVMSQHDRINGINKIRADLGRILILGLEFIVAADLIGTTTTPDYYALGLAAIIVLIRTVLSFSLNRELMSLNKGQG